MARIRTIKPDFWEDEQVALLSPLARLLFIGSWNLADDAGRLRWTPDYINASLFMYDNLPTKRVRALMDEVEQQGMAVPYAGGQARQSLAYLPNFLKHQKINRPMPSRFPAPPEPTPDPPDVVPDSLNDSVNDAAQTDAALTAGSGSGREEEMEAEGTTPSVALAVCEPSAPVAPDRPPQAVVQVFEAWLSATGRTNQTLLDAKRRRLIDRALKAYPLEDVLDAVHGWRRSPHHRGENPGRTVYNDLELLLRDAAHIEKFRDLERQAPSTNGAPRVTPGEHAIDRVFAQLPRGAA